MGNKTALSQSMNMNNELKICKLSDYFLHQTILKSSNAFERDATIC